MLYVIYTYIYIYDVIYILYQGPLHLKKNALK